MSRIVAFQFSINPRNYFISKFELQNSFVKPHIQMGVIEMLRSKFWALPLLSMMLAVPAAHAAADLTINVGTIPQGSFSTDGLYQIVEAGNSFNDTPRTAVYDQGGSLNISGSTTPLTSSNFSIAILFNLAGSASISGGAESLSGAVGVTYSFLQGSTILETVTTQSSGDGANLGSITLGPGNYEALLTGPLSGNEAEGLVGFQGTASAPSAVPEAATWTLMIAGFGIVGAALRRRHRLVAFATA